MPPQALSRARVRRVALIVGIVILGVIVIGRAARVLVDWLWFSSLGYTGVFWTILRREAPAVRCPLR